MSTYFNMPPRSGNRLDMRQKREEHHSWVLGPMETAGAMKLWKTQKQVSHNFTAPWKTRSRKSAAASFPQFPRGRLLGLISPLALEKQSAQASTVSIE
jgi:hypothetical protein